MTWEAILAVAGGIVLLGNAGAMIYKWIRPALQVKEAVEELDRRTRKDYETLQRIEQKLDHIERMQRATVAGQLDTINHMIDGNSKERMRETRDKIQHILEEG